MTSDNTPPLDTLRISAPNGAPTATVILLHGLGGSGRDMSSLVAHFQSDPALQHVQFIFPTAPTRPVTASNNQRMPAWSDIMNFTFTGAEDEQGMLETRAAVEGLVAREVEMGIAETRVVLGGFSQGAGMALLSGLTMQRRVGGVVVLSGRLPIRERVKEMAAEHVKTLPIFWGIGSADIRYKIIRESADFMLSEMGVPTASGETSAGVELHTYNGLTHSTSAQEMQDLGAWLKRVVPAV